MKPLIYLIKDVIVFVRVEMVTEADCPADIVLTDDRLCKRHLTHNVANKL